MLEILQPTLLRFDSIDSTNLEAMRQARAGASEGLCIVAREQTQGRGRLNRTWHSPKDAGLYFSIILRPQMKLSGWPLLTLVAALAVRDALISACALQTDIKWPNDVCVNDRKLAGILAETVETQMGPAAIVGIGINLSVDTSSGLPEATSVESVSGSKPDREAVLRELVDAIRARYEFLYHNEGEEHTLREWCANSSYAFGRRVRVALSEATFEGTTAGLEADGALRVEMGDGKITVVRAGDVRALRGVTNG